MLSNYEKRFFENGESVWFCRYTGLKNLLHWHFETEIILIESGNATVVLDSRCYNGSEGDVFFCPGGLSPLYLIGKRLPYPYNNMRYLRLRRRARGKDRRG